MVPNMTNTPRLTDRVWAHYCGVLRRAGGDCTANGITTKHDYLWVIGPDGAPEGFDPHGSPVLQIEERNIGGWVYTARTPKGSDGRHPMAGGNFVTSSDSRWSRVWGRYDSCISVHDRYEA
jgi:hypothetical protein